LFEHLAVGVGGDREPVGHQHAPGHERTVHLAQRGSLASHERDVRDLDLIEEPVGTLCLGEPLIDPRNYVSVLLRWRFI
jgi:hypothetical protein